MTRANHARLALARAATPASQCHVCRAWQSELVCAACVHAWRPNVRRCLRCAIDLDDDHPDTICQRCEDQSPEFDRAIVALDYSGPWPSLLARLKFQAATALAKPLARLLAEAAQPRLSTTDLILPVPLSQQRLRERGYNQAWLLARRVSQHLGIEARPDMLARPHHTQRLMSLSAEDRLLHIQEAFQVMPHAHAVLTGRHIAIVDDVMTTGATLNACARTLLEAGARSVSAWAVARTPARLDTEREPCGECGSGDPLVLGTRKQTDR